MLISKIRKVNLGSWRRSIQPRASQTNLEHNVHLCVNAKNSPISEYLEQGIRKGFSMLSLWSEVVWARYNLTKWYEMYNGCIVGWTMSMIPFKHKQVKLSSLDACFRHFHIFSASSVCPFTWAWIAKWPMLNTWTKGHSICGCFEHRISEIWEFLLHTYVKAAEANKRSEGQDSSRVCSRWLCRILQVHCPNDHLPHQMFLFCSSASKSIHLSHGANSISAPEVFKEKPWKAEMVTWHCTHI